MKYLILFSLLLKMSCSNAQVPVFKYSGNEFSPVLNKFITSHQQDFGVYIANYVSKNHHDVFSSICRAGITFVKFKVTSKGITDIACTEKSPELLTSAIKNAVKASEKYWSVSDASKEQVFILPWIYLYKTEGCDDPPFDPVTIGVTLDDGTSPYGINCILLKSVNQSSGPH